jgi:hypothetical protein
MLGKKTKFICSPIKLVKLIMSASSTAEQIHEYEIKKSPAWYMSEEGRIFYQKATTPNAKMQFFRSYLNTIKNNKTGDKIVDLAAYVLTCGVDGTSLPFATYPDILDPKKNPIVKIVREKAFPNESRVECGIEMLNTLLGDASSDIADWYNPKKRAYERLEVCSDSHNPSDMYKLQCYIIGAFCCVEGKMQAPYVYDIVSSAKTECDDNINDE